MDGDPSQLHQMIVNLCINANEAMQQGGRLTVADSGHGIAPADLRRIFEPFFTTKTGPDASGLGGTGLGLAVCRDIGESHHGRLRAESRLGQGTVFTLRLPSCPAPGAANPSQGAA